MHCGVFIPHTGLVVDNAGSVLHSISDLCDKFWCWPLAHNEFALESVL